MTGTRIRRLTPEQLVEREHVHRARTVRRVQARATRSILATDLVRLDRWARGCEVWTSSSERPAT